MGRSSLEIAHLVNQNMPSIGFMSRQKRIHAFNEACFAIEHYSTDEDGDIDHKIAEEAALILLGINKSFEKAYTMTIINFKRLPLTFLNEVAYNLAQAGYEANVRSRF